MTRDDDHDIPSFGVTRDEAVSSAPRGAVPSRSGRPVSASTAGLSIVGRLVLTVALVVAAVACAWAWQLQQALDTGAVEARELSARVADLEALLSDTDESVEKSAAALGAQLNVVDKETRRLEQRRREMDARLDKLEKSSSSHASSIASLKGTADSASASIKSLKSDLVALQKVAGDLERLSKTARDAQVNMERLADNVNKANLERAALSKKVTSNEEWIQSINAFRKQVNANINRLEGQIRDLSSPAGTMQ